MSIVKQFEHLLSHLNAEENDSALSLLSELKEAQDRLHWLDCLEGAGVDNWSGYEEAQDMYSPEYEDDEDE